MVKFDESKIITPLHTEKAEVGKEYCCADTLVGLKETVENARVSFELYDVKQKHCYPFIVDTGVHFQFLYPYEEQKQRMTNRQLAEWLARGNGERNYRGSICSSWVYTSNDENTEVNSDILIRAWDSEEWVEPTYEIYIKDCKGGNK